jgi:hypothetical protein
MTRTVRIPLDHARKLTDQDGENGGISHTPASTPTPTPAPTAPTC